MEEGQSANWEWFWKTLRKIKTKQTETSKKKHLKTQAAFTEEFDNLFGVIYKDFFQMINFQEVR